MNPKVSILIPIYKSAAYIERCAESLFNQTFEDIEYIFVNDGTPDDSLNQLQKVIDRYPNRLIKIKILNHSTNKGSAAARNTALNAAKGDYISYVDSDDYIEPEMIETLFLKAESTGADVVVSNTQIEFLNESILVEEYLSPNSEDHFIDFIKYDQSTASLCNKLVKRELYLRDECRFVEGLDYLEDRHVLTRVFYFAKKIVKVNRVFYHYIQYNKNSITKTKNSSHFENVIQFWALMDAFLKEQNIVEKYRENIEIPKVESKVRLMVDTNSSELRKKYANMFYSEEIHHLKHFKRGERLMLIFVRYKLFPLAQLLHNYLIFKHKQRLSKR